MAEFTDKRWAESLALEVAKDQHRIAELKGSLLEAMNRVAHLTGNVMEQEEVNCMLRDEILAWQERCASAQGKAEDMRVQVPMHQANLDHEEIDHLMAGKVMNAIKAHRARTGLGMKEAKAVMDEARKLL